MAVADCGHVDGGHRGGAVEVHGAWAVSLQSVAGRLATPLGHIKKKKTGFPLKHVTGPGAPPEMSRES